MIFRCGEDLACSRYFLFLEKDLEIKYIVLNTLTKENVKLCQWINR